MFPTSAFLSLCLPISMLPCKWGSTMKMMLMMMVMVKVVMMHRCNDGDDDADGGHLQMP